MCLLYYKTPAIILITIQMNFFQGYHDNHQLHHHSEFPYKRVGSILENKKFFELKSKEYRDGIKRKETR